MDCIAIIPARFDSERFPGKLLASLAGRPLIQHVVERCLAVPGLDATIVATDDERIAKAASSAGAEVAMTPASFASGTDRVAHVAEQFPADIIVNVQGDEPQLDPEALGAALAEFRDGDVELGTLRTALLEAPDLWSPDVVKVVVENSGRALFFSRAPIPFPRAQWCPQGTLHDPEVLERMPASFRQPALGRRPSHQESVKLAFAGSPRLPGPYWIHIGVYLYRRAALARWAALPPSPLELLEGLEQLRVLEAGEVMQTYLISEVTLAVNYPEDLERVRAAYTVSSAHPQETA
ncbi:MAG: 3-deoxy-manno-octulosonate cytidylyltransferase [Acidobacteriota bacterium]